MAVSVVTDFMGDTEVGHHTPADALKAKSLAQSERWASEAALYLDRLSARQLRSLSDDLAERQFQNMHPEFLRACVNVQIHEEILRRLSSGDPRQTG